MSSPAVTGMNDRRRRGRRFARELAAQALLRAAIEDAAKPREPSTGRAWINGREVGGTEPRHAHLAASYD